MGLGYDIVSLVGTGVTAQPAEGGLVEHGLAVGHMLSGIAALMPVPSGPVPGLVPAAGAVVTA
jgi:hypothetical protein